MEPLISKKFPLTMQISTYVTTLPEDTTSIVQKAQQKFYL